VERAAGGRRRPSESLGREHCRKGERENDSDRARRHESGRYNGGASARFAPARGDADEPGPSAARPRLLSLSAKIVPQPDR